MSGPLPPMELLCTERELAALCVGLGAELVPGWSAQERALVAGAGPVAPAQLAAARDRIRAGADPLGDAFCALRSLAARRPLGAVYTPAAIVDAMLGWGAGVSPARVVDPGCGSGRFLMAAGRRLPDTCLLGVELDPLAALMARANLAAAGLASRATVLLADYREVVFQPADGVTLFIGNPPYVRHHEIGARWKAWLSERAAAHGLRTSQLAGLHVHFLVATLERVRPGDAGVLVTAAEWLDVNYGQVVRDMLSGPLGCTRIDIIEPTAQAFAGAQATAVITCFRVGSSSPFVEVRRVADPGALAPLEGGRRVSRRRLAGASRWSALSRERTRRAAGLVELGELCRVHRGQVTGANRIWVVGEHTPPLPAWVQFPAITRARELFAADGVLSSAAQLRQVIALPAELDGLGAADREMIEAFLGWARAQGAHTSYIARHRSPWWSVKLREPAPILATYMARRPPAFVRNRAGARLINIAHGIYPREPLPEPCLDALAAYLATSVSQEAGRMYAGGLTKFEPREMERLLVPAPAELLGRSGPRERPCGLVG